MTTCGICVCPTPTPTLPLGDLCTVVNDTHALCSYGFTTSHFSWWNAFSGGITFTLIGMGFIAALWYLTHKEKPEKKE